jgi:WD40 repeat protein
LPRFLAGPFVARRGGQSVVFESRANGSAVVAALPSGRILTRLDGRFPNPLVRAAFSADGSTLATETQAATSLWNVGNGRRIDALPGEMSLPPDHPFDSAGQRLLTITEKGVRVWDVRHTRPITDLPHPRQVGSATFSTDGRLVLTASYDGFARVWEARTGRLVARFRGRASQLWNEGFVPHALFGPDNRTVVAATGGATVFVADCAICVPLRSLLAQAAEATTRSLTADERRTFLGE